jgi:hypothetical protein
MNSKRQEEVEPEIMDRVVADVKNSVIGFIKIIPDRPIEDGRSAGSGTLVSIGMKKGILTAAHVIHNLRNDRFFGIIRFQTRERSVQRLRVETRLCDSMLICIEPFEERDGPDIGFLQLPPDAVAELEISNVFLNLDRVGSSGLDVFPPYQWGVRGEDAGARSALSKHQAQRF